jgi:hypothetical protein
MDLVPAVVREAGPKAVESFLSFFAHGEREQSGSVYRSVAKNFFARCEVSGLQLNALRAGHIEDFLEAKRNGWQRSTEQVYFYGLRVILEFLSKRLYTWIIALLRYYQTQTGRDLSSHDFRKATFTRATEADIHPKRRR